MSREQFDAWFEAEYKHLESSKYTDVVPHIKYGFFMAWQAATKEMEAKFAALAAELEAAEKRIANLESLTAGMEQDPVYLRPFGDDGETFVACDSDDECAITLYSAPQLPQPEVLSVPDCVLKSLLPDAEKLDFWFEHNGKIFFEGVKFNNAVFKACRAAMIQAGNHTEQYLDMVDHSGEANEKGNSPVTPDGWQLVPKEPTVAMNKAGWAAINEHDEINPTYRAMLAAAPQQGVKQ